MTTCQRMRSLRYAAYCVCLVAATAYPQSKLGAGPEKRTWIVLALAGLFTVGTMSLTNFQLDSDFKWLLLIPSLLWIIGLVFPTVISRRDG